MSAILTAEQLVPLAQLAAEIPPGHSGRATHLSTILRWIMRGARGPDGALVRLEAVRIGGRWMTSREAFQRFAEALTPRPGTETVQHPRTPGRRRRASERAAEKLAERGI